MKTNNDVYRQLQRHLDSMPIPFPESKSGLDIKLLQYFFTPEEAKIALELSALPEPVNRIHKRLKDTGISVNELESTLDKMVEKGAILGGKIFESKALEDGWDGKKDGHGVPLGVYTYIISLEQSNGKHIKKAGSVFLLR